jgi:signal transduction histidine kinase/CheY-like chemotaxis protein
MTSGVALWLLWYQTLIGEQRFSLPVTVLPAGALLLLAWLVRKLLVCRPVLARHLLVWGLTVALLIAMWRTSEPWPPFLGVPLILISSLLISGSGFVIAGGIAVVALWLVDGGLGPYLLIALACGVALAWVLARTFYTALEWAWAMQQRADQLLELARDRQGELSNALKSVDIANAILRRTQRELISARKQAQEAQLMKEQFAANVSHELRTPLNLILGFSEMMYLSPGVYGNVEWPPILRQDVQQIYASSRHLLEMIDDVLDLSRFEIAGFTLHKESTPLGPLLQESVEIVEDLFRGRAVRLEADLPDDLPVLDVDCTRIRQVVLNLLNNAHRFTEEGVVRVAVRVDEGEVVVSVYDTGIGIPADELPYLFDEFYRVDRSLRSKHGGTGLGLAISKRFVEAHDGRIWVESEEGVGSTFSFTLPIPGQGKQLSRLSMGRPLEISNSGARAPILVVDPDPGVVALVRRHIEEYDVIKVAAADHLVEKVMLHHPRAVVCNLPSDKGNGCAARPWDELAVPVPLIECSLPSQAWLAGDLAVAACLTKPITTAQLLEVVDGLGDVQEVLVVDDDWGFCQLVSRMLALTGPDLHVRRVYDGQDCLQAVRAQRPDLILLDLVMPGKDGFEVLEEMRREEGLADIPVVLLTATSYAEDALAKGDSQVVVRRPDGLSPAEVLRCLRAVIGVLEPHYDERSAPDEALMAQAGA